MPDAIIDACCLINLYATDRAAEILAACGGSFYVSTQVRAESLSIRRPDESDPRQLVAVPLDLAAALAAGQIQSCQLEGSAEQAAYVAFVTELDDGEASCLAIAQSRGWTVATDDRKAIRMAKEAGILVITTPELLKRWAEATQATPEEIAATLEQIEQYARFRRPRMDSPGANWWYSHRA